MTQQQPQTGAELLDEVRSFLERFCAFPSQAALDATTLWVAHTHAADESGKLVFESTPRLAILSNKPASGKTRCLELVEMLSRTAYKITDPTAPALINLINEENATICIDEMDVLFSGGEGQRAMRSMLNDGYKRGAKIARSKEVKSCFAPVALAGLGHRFCSSSALRPLYTRSIRVQMEQRRDDQKIDPFRMRVHGPIARGLKEALSKWASSKTVELATAWPDMPEGIEDRLADIWEPLLSVAEVAGEDWIERARDAALHLGLSEPSTDDEQATLTPTQRLLVDLQKVFFGAEKLPTATIIERLTELPDSPWRKQWPTGVSAAMELSSALKPLGINVTKVWSDGRALQGYRWSDIEPQVPELFTPASDLPTFRGEESPEKLEIF